VPKITVILRKAYGGAYLAMCSSDMGADFVFAWPTAEIAVMGAEGAVKILYKREIAAAKDPKAKEEELVAEYRDKFCSPYEAAKKAMITDVIAPSETRARISLGASQHPHQARISSPQETRDYPALNRHVHPGANSKPSCHFTAGGDVLPPVGVSQEADFTSRFNASNSARAIGCDAGVHWA
jgi:hypothetical protein